MCVEMKSKPFVRISGTEVRAKEVILVCLALALLVFSITLFFKNWRKNYWDINQLPYYAYLYKVGIHTSFNIIDIYVVNIYVQLQEEEEIQQVKVLDIEVEII